MPPKDGDPTKLVLVLCALLLTGAGLLALLLTDAAQSGPREAVSAAQSVETGSAS